MKSHGLPTTFMTVFLGWFKYSLKPQLISNHLKLIIMKTTFFYCLLFMAALSISACSQGEDGEDGLLGPQGEQGLQGEQGPQGEQGSQGEPGTANVMFSDWMPIVWNRTNNPTFKSMLIEDEQVTEEFINNGGIILIFIRQTLDDGTIAIGQLPIIKPSDNIDVIYVNLVNEDTEGIAIRYYRTNGSDPLPDNATDGVLLRYVLIPGGIDLSGKGEMKTDWRKMSYQQVLEKLAIDE